MGSITETINRLLEIADNNSHGYSQAHRYGPDYDCSSSLANALIHGGFSCPKTSTTATLPNWLKANGWVEVHDGCKRGDIYCTEYKHVVMAYADGYVITAAGNKDGKTGDSSGREIYKRTFYTPSYGWNHHLRYYGNEPEYEIGKTYHINADNLNIRTGAGTNYRIKSKSELTENAKKVTNAKGQLMRGTPVTCKEVSNGWMRIPSGWISTGTATKRYVI